GEAAACALEGDEAVFGEDLFDEPCRSGCKARGHERGCDRFCEKSLFRLARARRLLEPLERRRKLAIWTEPKPFEHRILLSRSGCASFLGIGARSRSLRAACRARLGNASEPIARLQPSPIRPASDRALQLFEHDLGWSHTGDRFGGKCEAIGV